MLPLLRTDKISLSIGKKVTKETRYCQIPNRLFSLFLQCVGFQFPNSFRKLSAARNSKYRGRGRGRELRIGVSEDGNRRKSSLLKRREADESGWWRGGGGIYRGYYAAARRYEFYFRVVKYCFLPREKKNSYLQATV